MFDSGIGGLSVLHTALSALPDCDFIYYADEAHVPYGERSDDELRSFVGEIIAFLLDRDVDAIVIACNTATTVATKAYRESLPVPVIGMEPAVKKAVESFGGGEGRILVAATPVTIAGDKLHDLIGHVDQGHDVDLIALPKLVLFAEEGDFDSPVVDEYLTSSFAEIDPGRYDAFVLGCTHFNYFKRSLLEQFDSSISFVDGNEGTVHQLMRKLGMSPEDAHGGRTRTPGARPGRRTVEFYSSGVPVRGARLDFVRRCLDQLDLVSEL
jgi:glutamate racemase